MAMYDYVQLCISMYYLMYDFAAKKRRHSEGEEQQKPKRRRRLKYSLLQEELGGEEDCGEAELVSNVINLPRPPPKTGGSRCLKRSKDTIFPTPSVADIFCKLPRERKMEDVSSLWEGDDQVVLEGYDEFLSKKLKTDTASMVENFLLSKEQVDVRMVGARSLENELDEDDIWKEEDDLFKEEDGSLKKLADDTLSLMEQRCLRNVVTSPSTPDQPNNEVVVEHRVVPISPSDDQTRDISNIEWATRILDAAFLDNTYDDNITTEVGNILCEEGGQDESVKHGMMMSSVRRTGDDDVTSVAAGSHKEEDRRMDSLVDVNSGTVTPSMDRISAASTDTGKKYSVHTNNFTCAAKRDKSPEVGMMSPCLMGNGDVETTPLLSRIKESNDDDVIKSPCSDVNDDNGGGGGSQSLCDPGTVVPSMVEVSTSSKPGVAILGTKTLLALPCQPPGQGYGCEFPQVNTCQG